MKVINVLSAYSYTYFLFYYIVIGQACIYANEHGDLSSNKNLLLLFLAQIAITSAVAVLIKVLSDLVYKGIKKAKRRS